MTNAEINQKLAIKNLEEGKLNAFEETFVNQIRNLTKKELNKLSSKRYKILTQIADK